MSNLYRKAEWIAFRKEVIELDGGLCVRCQRSEASGTILQIHHKEYLQGRLPWEYPYELCETLCKGCHAEEHGEIPPKTGWEFLMEEDLGDLCGNCDYCKTDIRYVFYIQHQKWEPIGVGTICCDNLTETKLASNFRDVNQRYFNRLKRFIGSSRWKDCGKYIRIRQKRIDIEIHPFRGGYQIHINGFCGKGAYKYLEEAKKKVFEVIENGEAEKFLRRNLRSCPLVMRSVEHSHALNKIDWQKDMRRN